MLRIHEPHNMQHGCTVDGCASRFVSPHDMRRHLRKAHGIESVANQDNRPVLKARSTPKFKRNLSVLTTLPVRRGSKDTSPRTRTTTATGSGARKRSMKSSPRSSPSAQSVCSSPLSSPPRGRASKRNRTSTSFSYDDLKRCTRSGGCAAGILKPAMPEKVVKTEDGLLGWNEEAPPPSELKIASTPNPVGFGVDGFPTPAASPASSADVLTSRDFVGGWMQGSAAAAAAADLWSSSGVGGKFSLPPPVCDVSLTAAVTGAPNTSNLGLKLLPEAGSSWTFTQDKLQNDDVGLEDKVFELQCATIEPPDASLDFLMSVDAGRWAQLDAAVDGAAFCFEVL